MTGCIMAPLAKSDVACHVNTADETIEFCVCVITVGQSVFAAHLGFDGAIHVPAGFVFDCIIIIAP